MTIHVDKEQEWDPFVKKVMDKLAQLEGKIDLIKSDVELQVKEFDKVIKNKKVK